MAGTYGRVAVFVRATCRRLPSRFRDARRIVTPEIWVGWPQPREVDRQERHSGSVASLGLGHDPLRRRLRDLRSTVRPDSRTPVRASPRARGVAEISCQRSCWTTTCQARGVSRMAFGAPHANGLPKAELIGSAAVMGAELLPESGRDGPCAETDVGGSIISRPRNRTCCGLPA